MDFAELLKCLVVVLVVGFLVTDCMKHEEKLQKERAAVEEKKRQKCLSAKCKVGDPVYFLNPPLCVCMTLPEQ